MKRAKRFQNGKMERIYGLTIFLMVLSIHLNAQIWSEDFSYYVENTGVEGSDAGPVNIGDYPDNVSKWTLDVSGCTLSNSSDYFKTRYVAKKLWAVDTDGPAIWQSELIDVSAYTSGSLLQIALEGDEYLESGDYVDVYYQPNSGDFVRIANYNNLGDENHTLVGSFASINFSADIPAANTVVLKVVFCNNSANEDYKMDDIALSGKMLYSSAGCSQNTDNIAKSRQDQQIIGIQINTTGSVSPLSVTEFVLNMNGSDGILSDNLENAKLYYTGTTNIFSAVNQFGSTYANPSLTDFAMNGSRELAEGSNYFWLCIDTKSTAETGDVIDAECVSVEIAGLTKLPDNSAPAGSRTLSAALAGAYSIASGGDYTDFSSAVADLNNLGISANVMFSIASGIYTEQITLGEVSGVSVNDSIGFAAASGNADDVILQASPDENNNFVWEINGTDYLNFSNITMQTNGSPTHGRVMAFKGGSTHIRIQDCKLIGVNTSETGNDFAVLFAEGTASDQCAHFQFVDNEIENGSYGVCFSGYDVDNLESDNCFKDNSISNFNRYGIYLQYQDAVELLDNELFGKNTNDSENGIVLENCNNGCEIRRNQVFLASPVENYGILLNSCIGTALEPGLIVNNFISLQKASFSTEGIGIMHSGQQKLYQNTVNIYASGDKVGQGRSGANAAMSLNYYTTNAAYGNIEAKNNMFVSCGEAVYLSHIAAVNDYLTECNFNNYFTDWTSSGWTGPWGVYGSTNCESKTAWESASGLDGSSTEVDPQFSRSDVPVYSNENLDGSVSTIMATASGDLYMLQRGETTTSPGATSSDCNVWLGTVSDNYNDAANWSKGEVPHPNDARVIIQKGNPHDCKLPDHMYCKDIFLEQDAGFDMNNQEMDVSGDFISKSEIVENPGAINFVGDVDIRFVEHENLNGGGAFEITINKANGKKVLFLYNVDVKTFTLLGGTADLGNNELCVSEAVDLSGGSIEDITRLVMQNSSSGSMKTGNNILPEVIIDKDGNAIVDLQDELNTAVLKILSGKLAANSNIVTTGNLVIGQANGSTAELDIEEGKSVTVNDSLILEETALLKVKAGESETGKLIPKQKVVKRGNGKAQVQQRYSANEWHFVSSPIEEATAATFEGKYLQYHNESDNSWHDITDPATVLNVMQGYSLGAVTSGYVMAEFEGTPNSGSQSFDFAWSGNMPADEFGWNLIGNPYPCVLDWDEVIIPGNLDATIYLWDPDINDYRYYLPGGGSNTASQYVALAQGFMVHCNHTDGGTLTFSPDAMSTQSATFYKEQEAQSNCLTYELEGYTGSKGSIRVRDDATEEFDPMLDVYRLEPFTEETPFIYIPSSDNKLAVNSLPQLPDWLDLELILEKEEVMKLLFTGLETFDTSRPIILEDRKEEVLIDLRSNPSYEFAHFPDDDPKRFRIHFKELTSVDDLISVNPIVYAFGDHVYIQQQQDGFSHAEVLSTSGQLVLLQKLHAGTDQLKINGAGCYIIRIYGAQNVFSKKILIR